MRKPLSAAILALMVGVFPALACGQQPPQALQSLTESEWSTDSDISVWTTAEGDTAYVVGEQQDTFRAHMSGGNTWVRCPDTTPVVNGDPFPLSAIADSAETMLRQNSGYGMNDPTLLLAECATTVAAMEDSIRNQ